MGQPYSQISRALSITSPTTSDSTTMDRNPLYLDEIIRNVLYYIYEPRDLLACARVNHAWNEVAIPLLWHGSANDMRYRTPEIALLNQQFDDSPDRFRERMRHVEHLLLHSGYDDNYPIALKALSTRQDSEALFRALSEGRGLLSLAIGRYPLKNGNLPYLWNLVVQPSIKSLTISNHLLWESLLLNRTPEHRFANLQAFSIHIKRVNYAMTDSTSRFIDHCDLKLIHINDRDRSEISVLPEIQPLIRSIANQKNLKVLSWIGREGINSSFALSECILRESGDQKLWTDLEGIYAEHLTEPALARTLELWTLRIINLYHVPVDTSFFITEVARFSLLEVLVLRFDSGDVQGTVEAFSTAVQSFKFTALKRLWIGQDSPGLVGGEARRPAVLDILPLLPGLPDIEQLTTRFAFLASVELLKGLHEHCPRLSFLDLKQMSLHISWEALKKLKTFDRLNYMVFKRIFFQNPRQCFGTNDNGKLSISDTWRKVFSHLSFCPCQVDDLRDNEIHKIQDRRIEDGGVRSAQAPALDGDYDKEIWFSDTRFLRILLWRDLNYKNNRDPWHGSDDPLAPKPSMFEHMWQSNWEIKAFGFPILPYSAFAKPQLHTYPPGY